MKFVISFDYSVMKAWVWEKLGWLYHSVEKNSTEACKVLQKAAAQKISPKARVGALYFLGQVHFDNGTTDPSKYKLAQSFRRHAAFNSYIPGTATVLNVNTPRTQNYDPTVGIRVRF